MGAHDSGVSGGGTVGTVGIAGIALGGSTGEIENAREERSEGWCAGSDDADVDLEAVDVLVEGCTRTAYMVELTIPRTGSSCGCVGYVNQDAQPRRSCRSYKDWS
jgi:hypothetical protein